MCVGVRDSRATVYKLESRPIKLYCLAQSCMYFVFDFIGMFCLFRFDLINA